MHAAYRHVTCTLSAILAFTAFGCSPASPLACPKGASPNRSVKVFFATDRSRAPGDVLEFENSRNEPPGLHMGWQSVALGNQHRLGRVDRAVAILPSQSSATSPQPNRTNAMRRTDDEIAAFVNTTLRHALRASPAPLKGEPRQVFFFIHGYNTTFDEAIRKTAQLAGDLEWVTCAGEQRGVAVAYSWPAMGSPLSYFGDEENAEWTQQRVVPFIDALSKMTREEHAELHLIAHSMGARVLVRSLADLATACDQKKRNLPLAHQVILLAPDIGKSLFDQYAERFLPRIDHLTIYVSTHDRALALSTFLHGSHSRLGLLQPLGFIESGVRTAMEFAGLNANERRGLTSHMSALGVTPVDMIDVTGGIAGTFGHSYEDPAFIRDIRALIYHDTPAGTGSRSELEAKNLTGHLLNGPAGKHLRYFRLHTSRRLPKSP